MSVVLLVSSCVKTSPREDGGVRSTVVTSASAQASTEQTFDELRFPAPDGFTLKDDTTETIPSAIPGSEPAVERFRSYFDAAGKSMSLFSFRGFSGRDRGPMKADETWTRQVAGREARLSRASMFFGTNQNVLTAHFEGPSGAQYLVYTTRLDSGRVRDLPRAVFHPLTRAALGLKPYYHGSML